LFVHFAELFAGGGVYPLQRVAGVEGDPVRQVKVIVQYSAFVKPNK